MQHGIRRLIQYVLLCAYHLLYYQFAFLYDLAAWIVSAGEWADWRRCVLPYLANGRVLEAAHGTGSLALEMAAQGHAVIAFDLSPAMGRIARRKHQTALRNLTHGIHAHNPFFLRANIFQLPLESESFSCVVSTFPADFVVDPFAIREIYRILQPGGKWLIVPTAYPVWMEAIWRKQSTHPNISAFEENVRERMAVVGLCFRAEHIRLRRSVVVLWIVEK